MNAIRILLVVLVLGLAAPSVQSEELTAQKREDILQLLEMTGARSLGKQMAVALVAQLSANLRQSRPDIPPEAIDALPEVVGAVFEENIDSFIENVIPLYHKHFTASEIRGMIEFYSTPLGRKTVEVLPALMGESMRAGQQWGEGLAPEIDRRIREHLEQEGVEL